MIAWLTLGVNRSWNTAPHARTFATRKAGTRYARPLKWTTLGTSSGLLAVSSSDSAAENDKVNSGDTDETKTNVVEPSSFWNGGFSESINSVLSQMSSWTWPNSLRVSGLQDQISALLLELSLGPGSLYSEVTRSPPNLDNNPELDWDAEVRLGEEIPLSERAFLEERRRLTKKAFAQLMSVEESEVDDRDIPVVAIAGSGGGFRAMLNTIGSLAGAQSTGLLDVTTYIAGISGSCWALSALYSGVAGTYQPSDVAMHLKDRIQTSYLDSRTLDALITPPTNKYLLSGVMHKSVGTTSQVSLVDIYGTLIASRILVPSDLSRLNPRHLSLHNFRQNVDNGRMPLPIFTAIQAVPPEPNKNSAQNGDGNSSRTQRASPQQTAESSRWLWYEFTPFEVGCDEIGAWIPSWALGRQFMNGKNLERRPELSLTILTGEIQPALTQLPFQLNEWFENILFENQNDLLLVHPVLPNQLPNFVRGLNGQLRFGSPSDITEKETFGFLDAGADLNIPYYPLLRRNVDCIIALDASADSQDLWFTRAEELAAKRGLSTWPRGARWPTGIQSTVGQDKRSQSPDSQTATRRLAQTQEAALTKQVDKTTQNEMREMPEHPHTKRPQSACEIWIGSSKPQDGENSRFEDLDEEVLLQRDGIGVVYMPLLANETKVPGFDPFVVSTWRRDVKAEESQQLLDLARENFIDSSEKITRLLRAIWTRKKREREAGERKEEFKRWKRALVEYNLFHI